MPVQTHNSRAILIVLEQLLSTQKKILAELKIISNRLLPE
jgi:hypothetical protein